MREELQTIIDSHYGMLTQQLDIKSGILNTLLSQRVITSDHLEQIKAEKTGRQSSEVLLEILKKCDDEYYKIFREAVAKHQKQLAEKCLPPVDDDEKLSVPQPESSN